MSKAKCNRVVLLRVESYLKGTYTPYPIQEIPIHLHFKQGIHGPEKPIQIQHKSEEFSGNPFIGYYTAPATFKCLPRAHVLPALLVALQRKYPFL